jgi:hypothetical protein
MLRAMAMRMEMPVLLAGIMPMRVQMDALSPQRESHGHPKTKEHHSHTRLKRFFPRRWNCNLEQQDACSDHQQDEGMPHAPAKSDERGAPHGLILRRDGQDRRNMVGIQRVSDAEEKTQKKKREQVGIKHEADGRPSSPSGMHLEVWVPTKPFDFDQPFFPSAEALKSLALFGPPILPALPDRTDLVFDVLGRSPGSQELA